MPSPDVRPSDLLYGLDAIAAFLRMKKRSVKYRAQLGEIPTFKIGRTVCARERTLASWLAQRESEGNETYAVA